MRHAFACLTGSLVVASSAAAGLPRVSSAGYPPGERLVVHGVIDEELATELIPKLERARYLHIFSGGGEVAAAARIAEQVRKHKVIVVVDGRCVSACAHLIAVAAPELQIGPRGKLLFHNSPWVWRRGLAENPQLATAELLEKTRRDMQISSSLYRRVGFDTRLLACTDRALDIDYGDAALDTRVTGRPGEVFMRARFFAQPSLELLSRAGVKVVRWEGLAKQYPDRAPATDPQVVSLEVADCPDVGRGSHGSSKGKPRKSIQPKVGVK
jgi:hypothetical protein